MPADTNNPLSSAPCLPLDKDLTASLPGRIVMTPMGYASVLVYPEVVEYRRFLSGGVKIVRVFPLGDLCDWTVCAMYDSAHSGTSQGSLSLKLLTSWLDLTQSVLADAPVDCASSLTGQADTSLTPDYPDLEALTKAVSHEAKEVDNEHDQELTELSDDVSRIP